MESRRSRRAPSGRAGWLLLAVVVAGLFAMHGLGTHGLHSDGSSPATHALHQGPPSELGAVGPTGSAHPALPAADAPEHPAPGSGVVEMCLALLALGLVWLAGLGLRRVAWTVPRDTLVARLDRLRVTARGPGPPRRVELSVWRC